MNKLIVPQWPLPRGVVACSSTHVGGVSLPPYDSLDLGVHYGDNPGHVEESRKRLFAADNLPSKPIQLEQVHDKNVLKFTSEPYASKRTDASYSNTPGTVYAVMTANYLPALFCNRAGAEVAATHAGWRGLCADVLKETVSCSADNPGNILAWLGPVIGPRAFEVRTKVHEAFIAVDARANTVFIQHGDKYLTDIYQPARQHLASVDVGQVFGGDRCTYTENETFFSYRRDKTIGCMASFI